MILIDPAGDIYLDQEGEGGYGEFELAIQKLLRTQSPGLASPPILSPLHPSDAPDFIEVETTDEMLLGLERKALIEATAEISEETPDAIFKADPAITKIPGKIYLEGLWKVAEKSIFMMTQTSGQKSISYRGSYKINIVFIATDVFIMARTKPRNLTDVPQSAEVRLTLNGNPMPDENEGPDNLADDIRRGFLSIRLPKLYHIATNLEHRQHELTLEIADESIDGIELYAVFFQSTVKADSTGKVSTEAEGLI
jgi:hypothetical protein